MSMLEYMGSGGKYAMWRMQSIPQLFPITIGKSPISHGAFTLLSFLYTNKKAASYTRGFCVVDYFS